MSPFVNNKSLTSWANVADNGQRKATNSELMRTMIYYITLVNTDLFTNSGTYIQLITKTQVHKHSQVLIE